MADEVTFESVQSLFNTFVQDEKVRTMVQKQMTDQGGGLPFFNRSVRPTDDEAPAFIRSSMHGIFMGEVQALEGAGRSCWDFTDDDAPQALIDALAAEGQARGWEQIRWMAPEKPASARRLAERLAEKGGWLAYSVAIGRR